MDDSLAPLSRRQALGLMARAAAADLTTCVAALGALPGFIWLRKPETGLVMLRARIGGNGAKFNLGETTVTRCALRLENGCVGIGTVRGRNVHHAEQIALCDALLQQPAFADRIRRDVLDVLEKAECERRAQRSAEVAATKVDFFTLVRGDD